MWKSECVSSYKIFELVDGRSVEGKCGGVERWREEWREGVEGRGCFECIDSVEQYSSFLLGFIRRERERERVLFFFFSPLSKVCV